MTNTTKTVLIGVAVLVVGFILGSLAGNKAQVQPQNNFGATMYDQANLAGGATIGATGSYMSKVRFGTCNLTALSTSTDGIAAWAAKRTDCAATGVVSGDNVRVTLPKVNGSYIILANASASTTNGYITVNLVNATSTVSAVSIIGTSTQWQVIDN